MGMDGCFHDSASAAGRLGNLAAMSIINQVLNELEKRGANPSMGEDTIRAVPQRKQSHLMRYLLLAMTLLVALALAKWYPGRAENPALDRSVAIALPMNGAITSSAMPESTASASVEAENMNGVSGVSQSLDSLHGKPLLEVKSEEEPVAVPEIRKTVKRKQERHAGSIVVASEDSAAEDSVNRQIKTITPQQRAESEFQKANQAVQEGRTNDALAGYEGALLIDSSHKAARRAWVGLLLNLKRNDEAEKVLQRGLKRDPHDTSFAMLLARLQVERNDIPLALETLQKTLPYAEGQADFHAFLAALLQRQSRHEEAIAYYQVALKLVPGNGIWLMGLGISLQALQRKEDARDAFQRALASNSLSVPLQAFVQQKLKEL
jgi:MSHA biogenesis protein MshN